jgi:hypothetical protein
MKISLLADGRRTLAPAAFSLLRLLFRIISSKKPVRKLAKSDIDLLILSSSFAVNRTLVFAQTLHLPPPHHKTSVARKQVS